MGIVMTIRTIMGSISVFAGVAVLGALACERLGRRAAPDPTLPQKHAPVVGLGPENLSLPSPRAGAHRLLLDARALGRLKESARTKSRAFGFAKERADLAAGKVMESGYQAFEWADAVAGCALMWHATGDEGPRPSVTCGPSSTIDTSSETAKGARTW
jgi:hypothetical protein